MRKGILMIMFFLPAIVQPQDILDEYIRLGLENNLSLKQKQSDYLKSIEALRGARGLFLPGISFGARYTVSEGGRVINFPAGQLLNPVYSTLNSLTFSSMFPQADDIEFRFLRPTEHETRLRLTQPVFNTGIYYNARIREEMSFYVEADRNQYRRELIAAIKKSYYDLAVAEGMLSVLGETGKLLSENVRVSKKLFENDKVTRDVLYRSEAELSKLEQEIQNAEKLRKSAGAYFNFLLNRPLEDSVIIVQPHSWPLIEDFTGSYTESALENREELKKLERYSGISSLKVKMDQSESLPEMFIAVDYGFQGEKYKFNRDFDYMQASAVLTWNLFTGFQTRSRIRQSMLDKSIVDTKIEEAKKQIELEVLTTLNELLAAEKGITAAEKRLLNAREGFRLIKRKYEEGQASLMEFLDASTTLTQSEMNLIISRFRYLSCFAEFEKVTTVSKY